MIGTVQDITAHKKSEELQKKLNQQLERERAMLRALIDQAPSGIIIVEAPSGKHIIYNDEAAKILAHPLLPSKDYTDYVQYRAIHEDGTPYRAEEYPLARALLHGEIVHQEHMCYQRSDGAIVHLSVNAAPVNDERGNRIAAISTFLDISASYNLERHKDAIIGIAGHELRTPITAMQLSLQMVERKLKKLLANSSALDETEMQTYELIQGQIDRCLRQVGVQRYLINDLLDVSRIQTGKLRLSLRNCNLARIVRNAVEDLRATMPARSIYYDMWENAEIIVLADEERLNQIVNNYLTNALKYSPETEPVHVGISIEGQYVRTWVQDKGPGLSEEVQQHIWEQFYQVSGAQLQQIPSGDGLGLGLYICRKLVERQGGTVGVESKLGEGSRFWFILPLVRVIDDNDEPDLERPAT
jgi:signal transduction histidine kinase